MIISGIGLYVLYLINVAYTMHKVPRELTTSDGSGSRYSNSGIDVLDS